MSKRINWDLYFMNIAVSVSLRATCDRKHVGAVIVSSHKEIIASGYNGAVSGELHCDEVGHDISIIDGKESCQRVVHSEINAIAQAARRGSRLAGSTMYVTSSPCWPCFRAIVHAGVYRVVYGEEFYRDFEKIQEVARNKNIELSYCDVRYAPMSLYNAAVAASKDSSAGPELDASFERTVAPRGRAPSKRAHLQLVKPEDEPK